MTHLLRIASALVLTFAVAMAISAQVPPDEDPDPDPDAEISSRPDLPETPDQRLERQVPRGEGEVLLSYAPVVREVAPAVVNIFAARKVEVSSPFANSPFFQRFFGDNFSFGVPRERVQRSLGSGVIVRPEGIIVTNNHVIKEADVIKVVLNDRREFAAETILTDERTDLAILRITDGEGPFPTAQLDDSDDVAVGDIVLAIGNPFGIGQSVSGGIVSATARTQTGISDFGFFIQTDAAVNPGNSGGALVGLRGTLLGINTAIFSRTGDTSGIGFAIPANMVRSVLRAALDGGELVRPWLGIAGQSVNADMAAALGLDRPGGVIVDRLYPDAPADDAGLAAGDVILEVDGKEVIDEQGMRYRIATREEGEKVTVTVLRGEARLDLPVMLMTLPETPERNLTTLEGRHPFQGVTVGNLSPRFAQELGLNPMAEGVIVTEVARNSPAARVGYVRPGDLLLVVQDRRIEAVRDVILASEGEWEQFVYRIRRGNEILECGIFRNGSVQCRRGQQ